MHTAHARAQHLRFQFKCGFKPFRLPLLLLTQVSTATTKRSREFDSNWCRSDCFHHTASGGWDRTCWSISILSLESMSVSLRHHWLKNRAQLNKGEQMPKAARYQKGVDVPPSARSMLNSVTDTYWRHALTRGEGGWE